MYKAFIEPDLKTAHLKIYNTFNPFSGFMDPTYILKSDRKVSKDTIHSLLKVCVPVIQTASQQEEMNTLILSKSAAAKRLSCV